MAIQNIQSKDYGKLVKLYKSFFKTHNIFQQPDQKVANYLKKQEKDLIVYYDNGSLRGALFLVNSGQNADGSHKIWKFRHFAFENEEIASELLGEAEKRVRKASQTSKIELNLAETEQGINFYKSKGYKQEGTLSNHYRWGETCFILSKSFS